MVSTFSVKMFFFAAVTYHHDLRVVAGCSADDHAVNALVTKDSVEVCVERQVHFIGELLAALCVVVPNDGDFRIRVVQYTRGVLFLVWTCQVPKIATFMVFKLLAPNQVFCLNCLWQRWQVTRILPRPRGARSCWRQPGQRKYLYCLRSRKAVFLNSKPFLHRCPYL